MTVGLCRLRLWAQLANLRVRDDSGVESIAKRHPC